MDDASDASKLVCDRVKLEGAETDDGVSRRTVHRSHRVNENSTPRQWHLSGPRRHSVPHSRPFDHNSVAVRLDLREGYAACQILVLLGRWTGNRRRLDRERADRTRSEHARSVTEEPSERVLECDLTWLVCV